MKKLVALFSFAAIAGGVANQAHAALPADVTTALDTAQVDGVELAGIVLAIIIAIAAFKYIRRAL